MSKTSKYAFLKVQAVGLCLVALLSGCQSEGKPAPKEAAGGPKSPPLVAVAQPVKPDTGQVREYMGTVESRNQISLVPQVAGQLLAVNASVGDRVSRGQVLAVVEDPELEARLSQAQATVAVAQAAVQTAMANARASQETVRSRQQAVQQADASIAESEAAIAKARSDLKLAQTTLGRTKQLEARQLIASQELDQAEADASAAAADLSLAQARLRSSKSEKKEAELDVGAAREQQKAAEAQISSAQAQAESLAQAARAVAVRSDLASLRSPIDGTVVSRQLDPGAYVSPGNQSVIMVLANTDDLRVVFDLSEADMGLVQPGQSVEVRFDALPDKLQTGVVAGLAGGLDPASRTVRVEVKLPAESGKIRPGMLGRLIVAGEGSENLLAIPLPAVISDKGKKFVFVMDAKNKVERRLVEVASLQGDTALISSGLKLEDKVVVQGVNLVREGQEVRTEGEKVMILTRLAVKNPIGVLMVCLGILVLATISASRIPIDMFPSLNVPALRIETKYPGASPEEIERTITYPLEQAIARVAGVVRVESDSEPGASRITLWFDWGTNLDAALVQVISNVQRAMNSLPEGLDPPAVSQFDVADFPVVQLAMHSPNLTPEQAYELGEYVIGPQLSRIAGVSEVRVRGGLLRQINVDCDAALLQARGVSLLEVRQALQNNNQLIPSGLFQNPELEYQLEVETMLADVEQIREVPVATRNNVVIKVRDIAKVEDGTAIPTQIFRVDSEQRVGIWIMMQPRTNVVQLSNAVREALKNLSGIPEGVKLDLIFDQSNYVRTSINGLVHEGIWGAILVSFVVMIFLRNWPSVILICTGIPLSLAAAVMMLYFGDQSLNIFTLGGLTLALGRVVDDAIVVRENITRHLEEATDSDGPVDVEKAVLDATGEVGMPVLASTLTTIAVFFPVVFLEGVSAKLFVPLALTISFAMIASYFVSLTVDPVLSIQWKQAQRTIPEHEMGFINRWLGRLYGGMESIYERTLAWVARQAWLIFLGVIGVAVGSYFAAATVATEFFPKSDESVISMRVESQMGTGAIAMGEICAKLEDWIREVVKEGEVLAVITSAGTPSNSARMFVRLSLPTERTRSAEQISQAIRKNVTGKIPGVRAVVTPGGLSQRVLNFGAGAAVEVQLLGHDQEAGSLAADELSRTIGEVPGVVDVRVEPQGRAPSLQIDLDRQRIALMGLTPAQVANTINVAMTGGSAGGNQFLDPVTGNEFNLVTRLSQDYRDHPEDLESVPVSVLFPTGNASAGNGSGRRTARVANANSGREITEAGKPLLVRDLASIELGAAPLMIRRTNQTRVIRVTGNNTEPIGAITANLRTLLKNTKLPPGFTYYIGGQAEQQERTFSSMMLAAALALMLVYMIMASQFGSLWEPLVIMVTVPLGLIGVVAIQLATGTPFSVMSFMGVIMMTGIVVSNGILLVEFAKTLRHRGMPLWEATMTAAKLRLRPIVMTALCTIVGMVPMAIGMGGSETNEPLALAVIGGLTVSTLLTLFVVPLVYRFAAEFMERRGKDS